VFGDGYNHRHKHERVKGITRTVANGKGRLCNILLVMRDTAIRGVIFNGNKIIISVTSIVKLGPSH
jgi:hypothetical protein